MLGFVYELTDQYTETKELVVVSGSGKRLLSKSVEAWPISDPNCSPCFGGYAIDAAGRGRPERDRQRGLADGGARTCAPQPAFAQLGFCAGDGWVTGGSPLMREPPRSAWIVDQNATLFASSEVK